jgi:hypothetical protein
MGRHRMFHHMKVTANISDEILDEVKRLSKKATIDEAVSAALMEWIDLYHVKELNEQILHSPLAFQDSFSASAIRESNRNR